MSGENQNALNELLVVLANLTEALRAQNNANPAPALSQLIAQTASMNAVLNEVAQNVRTLSKTVVDHDRWISSRQQLLDGFDLAMKGLEKRMGELEERIDDSDTRDAERRGGTRVWVLVGSAVAVVVSAVVNFIFGRVWR